MHSQPTDRGQLSYRGSSPLLCAPALRPARLLGYWLRLGCLLRGTTRAPSRTSRAPLHLHLPAPPRCWCAHSLGHPLGESNDLRPGLVVVSCTTGAAAEGPAQHPNNKQPTGRTGTGHPGNFGPLSSLDLQATPPEVRALAAHIGGGRGFGERDSANVSAALL